jgi:hypothetical protein
MARVPLPPVAAVIGFIDRINRGDPHGLARLMTAHHRHIVLDGAPLVGRSANLEAWRDYLASYPNYVICPERIAARGNQVAVLGTTTGSHRDLSDEEERRLPAIWVAEVEQGMLASWQSLDDTPAVRARTGLADEPVTGGGA